ncbi:hypothetical protein LTR10_017239 [Elasticomyces elasticus]|uniref:Uncharacterized protein n=1 Tax=Exophiala sideris TaxID=1016849 RepID=A0ABR0J5N6_9EURO|nr:hypothetical protein LTR10_017239 [Elasticomyces elasticus]KAK5028405.1 hypothetical protein LTS07_006496 [Exophiala sideris]KAK5035952.1 hypothetical protein LTR13_005522 [Exophiala sideris]KAK5056988.1 hypothetical protein LTR69_007626 [Exophiala sideris]KAK5181395.1 hypothetical protein LTR44_006190 [Eurotiomycetes sp. CCFEE 6388]
MDLDETMTTSTASTPSAPQDPVDEAFEDDNLFPGSALNDRPRTPANDHLNAAAPGELSPPRSQTHGEDMQINESLRQSIPNGSHPSANSRATRSAARQPGGMDARYDGAQSADPSSLRTGVNERDETPGWGWKDKKAQEEMQRAWESVIDRDFSLKEYGDVMMLGKAQVGQQ